MSENDIRFNNIIKALCPPFIYFFITIFVEACADLILFIREFNKINKSRGSFLSSYKFMDSFNANADKYAYVITFISATIAIVIFGIMYKKQSDTYEKNGFVNQFHRIKGKTLILAGGLGVFAGLGLSRAVSMLPLENIIGNYESTSNSLMRGEILFQILSLAIVVPIAEEIIYRGLVFTGLTKVMEAKYALFAVSLIFGIFHFNLLQGTYAFLLSVILVCVYMRFKSIIAPIIVHGAANMTAVIATYFKLSQYFNRNIWIYVAVMVVEIIAGLICFDLIMKEEEKKLQKK